MRPTVRVMFATSIPVSFAYASSHNALMVPTSGLRGSACKDENAFYYTPYDAGWGSRVNFDHEFVGKKALQKIVADQSTVPVTLEWDADDVAEVFASQFRGTDVEPCDDITSVRDNMNNLKPEYRCDRVYSGEKIVGRSLGRIHDFYHQRMISLGVIDKEFAALGNEVKVLWGTPGTAQKYIRVKVAPFPYYNEEYRNETFDVEKIPHPVFDK